MQDQRTDTEVVQFFSEVAARDFDNWMLFLLVFCYGPEKAIFYTYKN